MKLKVFLLIFLFSRCISAYMTRDELLNNLNVIKSKTPTETQKYAALDVIKRILPNYSHLFNVEIDENIGGKCPRHFQISKNLNDSIVLIKASDGVSACKAFYYYLKYYLGGHVSWSGNQLDSISNIMPEINYSHCSLNVHIYHQNVCTWGYSFAWWKWDDWRKHIDWMSLMGITLTIAPIQEAIWSKIYTDLGLNKIEIDEHFSGPAFLPWHRMGNLRGWTGPLSDNFMQKQLILQKKILKAQRELGMTVAIPGFAGYVPIGFKRLYPNVSLTSTNCWNDFSQQYCCPLFIDPNESLFQQIGTKFLQEVIEEYGTDHLYFSDPFNENDPKEVTVPYMSTISANIYSAMSIVDPNAIWLLQGWFIAKHILWNQKILQAFLLAVPLGKLLVLDLQSELAPQYERTRSYYGQPFIWCMLHNFGGTLGMHGSINIINTRIALAQNMTNSTMIGVGITPEGINQNYAIYEFVLERGWSHDEFDIDEWFKCFSKARYGLRDSNIEKAWKLITKTVYSYKNIIKLHGKYTIARRPSTNINPWIWYNPFEFIVGWKYFLEANSKASKSKLYQHDLVDITRQFLQLTGDSIYISLINGYKDKNLTNLQTFGDKMLEIFDDLELILKTNENFLLGNWLEPAKQMATTELEKEIYELNARNQITLWGPNGEINDYATKQWSGIAEDYFKPRWELFIEILKNSLIKQKKFNDNKFRRKVFVDIENPFSVQKKIYPTQYHGDSIKIAKVIFEKWTSYISSLRVNLKNIPVKVKSDK